MIEHVKGGFKVKKEHSGGYMSKKPMSEAKAKKQLAAEHINRERHCPESEMKRHARKERHAGMGSSLEGVAGPAPSGGTPKMGKASGLAAAPPAITARVQPSSSGPPKGFDRGPMPVSPPKAPVAPPPTHGVTPGRSPVMVPKQSPKPNLVQRVGSAVSNAFGGQSRHARKERHAALPATRDQGGHPETVAQKRARYAAMSGQKVEHVIEHPKGKREFVEHRIVRDKKAGAKVQHRKGTGWQERHALASPPAEVSDADLRKALTGKESAIDTQSHTSEYKQRMPMSPPEPKLPKSNLPERPAPNLTAAMKAMHRWGKTGK